MLQFISFSSGSDGNCYMLAEDGVGIMIDQGIGLRKLKKLVNEYGINLGIVHALLVTHDHFDHSKSVGETSALLGVPVYAHSTVHAAMLNNPHIYRKVLPLLRYDICEEEVLRIGCFKITPFAVPHDSAYNLGYFIETPTTNLCLITDVGCYIPTMMPYIKGARNLVIEANYDTGMLASGRYPAMLKRRISKENGHSSNEQTAKVLSEHLSSYIQRVFLCHLSANNNTPTLALHTIQAALHDTGFNVPVSVLPRTSPSGVFNLV